MIITDVRGMYEADRLTIEGGVSGLTLMEAAGRACFLEVQARWPDGRVWVFCGPGNNGGDGFVAARLLAEEGRKVCLYSLGQLSDLKGDAASVAALWNGETHELEVASPLEDIFAGIAPGDVIIDALFGAGLTRPLDGLAAHLAAAAMQSGAHILSVDLPSGLYGDHSLVGTQVFKAEATVTFAALKPAHVLEPAASMCGDVIVANIGITEPTLIEAGARSHLNTPELWADDLPWPGRQSHKHARGRLFVVAGPAGATGAARLAARAGLRSGAGVVTIMGQVDAIPEMAASSLAVMTRAYHGGADLRGQLERASACVIGPAAGLTDYTRAHVLALLSMDIPLVLDADALSVFEAAPHVLLDALHENCVLTPHVGEFNRLFPGVLTESENRMEAVRKAADRAECVVLLKGADTVIADPGGAVRVNVHSSPFLATAGSGDVLAGIVGGWLAQGVSSFDAASAASWMHGEASLSLGAGMIAEDLTECLPEAMGVLYARKHIVGGKPIKST